MWIVACLERRPQSDALGRLVDLSAVQNMLLAARALGLGSTLTTRHIAYEKEVDAAMGIPPGFHSYAILPIGYPMGRFGPVGRGPLTDVVYLDGWGKPIPGSSTRRKSCRELRRLPANPTFRPNTTASSTTCSRCFGSIRGPFSILLHSPKLAERL